MPGSAAPRKRTLVSSRSRRCSRARFTRRSIRVSSVHSLRTRVIMAEKQVLRVGVGGPVGSGKTALVDALCKELRTRFEIAVVTNDIYTREDADFLIRSGALPEER